MILPSLHGYFNQNDFFIYAAADRKYFDLYGRALIRSILQNTSYGCHMHLYNPEISQIEFCQQSRISVTWEHTATNQFDSALEFWARQDLPEPYISRKNKMLGLKQYSDNQDLLTWLYKTYYACMRFVRLAEFLDKPCRFLAIDVDGLVRKSFVTKFADDDDVDVYLYEKIKRNKITQIVEKTGHLAGSILFTPKHTALDMIHTLANKLKLEIESDNIYWFLDQHCIDAVISNYRKGLLPLTFIDWHMHVDSSIWTAKGKRKDLQLFKQELARYT